MANILSSFRDPNLSPVDYDRTVWYEGKNQKVESTTYNKFLDLFGAEDAEEIRVSWKSCPAYVRAGDEDYSAVEFSWAATDEFDTDIDCVYECERRRPMQGVVLWTRYFSTAEEAEAERWQTLHAEYEKRTANFANAPEIHDSEEEARAYIASVFAPYERVA